MNEPSPRLNFPVSNAELERRRAAVRAAMAEHGVDVLVVQSNSEDMGGYARYLTDLPHGGYGGVVVFPREDEPTLVMHGPVDGDRALPDGGDGVLRGVRRVLTSPYFPSAPYTARAAGDLTLRALAGYERAAIGVAGQFQFSHLLGTQLEDGLPDATFVDASDFVDRVKVRKSPEEQELIHACAALQDEAMRAVFDAAEPGKRESELAAIAHHVCSDHGSEAGIVLVGSGPVGGGWAIGPRHLQNRVLEEGDMLAVLVELNGPGGMFAELGRTAVLGDVPAVVEEELQVVLAAQRFTLERLVPGTSCAEVWDEYNAFLAEQGRPLEQRIHCHGQGVDLVERPLVRFDEPMAIEPGMNLACHPTWVHDGLFSWICDNYLIGDDGPGACLHAFPQEIVSL